LSRLFLNTANNNNNNNNNNNSTKDFMDKNNDALTHDLFTLMQTSKDPFTKNLFEPKEGEPIPKKGKLTLISLGKFVCVCVCVCVWVWVWVCVCVCV
jgi:hypothetical protein